MTDFVLIQDDHWMRVAIEAALESRRLGDYAIGAVVAKGDRQISVAGNRIRTEIDASSHTEMVAMRAASRDLQSRYLLGCTLYCTAGPCCMCLGMAIWAKVPRIVSGAYQKDIKEYGAKYGGETFKWRALNEEPNETYDRIGQEANPGMEFRAGVLRDECLALFHRDAEPSPRCPHCGK